MHGGNAMKTLVWLSFFAIGLFIGTAGNAAHRVPQGLGGIRKLDAKRARRLMAEFTGDELSLDSLTSLSTDAARVLADFKGRSLSLDGLKTLSPEAARALSAFEGKSLRLNGLSAICPATARALRSFKGTGMWACQVLRG
jgi:hypothetical protein